MNGIITNLFTGKNSYALLSTVNVPLTGATPLVIDGVTATNGMNIMLSNQTTAAQTGGYSLAITGGAYTLTELTGQNLNTGTTYNGGQPFDFQVLQGNANQGPWNYYDNGTIGVFTQYQTSANDLVTESITNDVASLAPGASTTVTCSFTQTYTAIRSASAIAYKDGANYIINLVDITPAASVLTERVYNVTNLGAVTATTFNINVGIVGVNYI